MKGEVKSENEAENEGLENEVPDITTVRVDWVDFLESLRFQSRKAPKAVSLTVEESILAANEAADAADNLANISLRCALGVLDSLNHLGQPLPGVP